MRYAASCYLTILPAYIERLNLTLLQVSIPFYTESWQSLRYVWRYLRLPIFYLPFWSKIVYNSGEWIE